MRIKEVLKEKKYTQQMLAYKMNVSLSAIKQMVSADSLTTSTLEKIASALDVPMWQLFASPDEVAKELSGDKCPYCGNPLRIKIEKGE
ncbi:helix-turn-helix domain-containing protein [Phocaeicola plebeius]|uniref:helix-turn-helix domain-containing protein n=1 Tax=Phocaeicola plebeius TaxID=310297 RepID=UPI00356B14D3